MRALILKRDKIGEMVLMTPMREPLRSLAAVHEWPLTLKLRRMGFAAGGRMPLPLRWLKAKLTAAELSNEHVLGALAERLA